MVKLPPPNPDDFPCEALVNAGVEMENLLRQQPQLTAIGFQRPDEATFTRARERMMVPVYLATFLLTREWIQRFPKMISQNQELPIIL
jgi:hypothetical protein